MRIAPAELPIIRTEGCWIWQGTLTQNGYGILTRGNQSEVAHRYVWRLEGYELDRKLTLDHLCCNKWCVNPGHLEQITFQENLKRRDERKRQRKQAN